jgi:hypothetical protein
MIVEQPEAKIPFGIPKGRGGDKIPIKRCDLN